MNQGEMKPQGTVEMKVIRGTGPRKKPSLLEKIKKAIIR